MSNLGFIRNNGTLGQLDILTKILEGSLEFPSQFALSVWIKSFLLALPRLDIRCCLKWTRINILWNMKSTAANAVM